MADFNRRILKKQDFDHLSTMPHCHTLVFQFYYENSGGNSPGLRVFAMKQNHKKIDVSAFRDLHPEPVIRAPIVLPDTRIQGDLQATKNDLLEILKNSNNPATAYDYFLFTPKLQNNSIHVVYEIEVVPTTLKGLNMQRITADPSPPASAA